MKLKLVLDTHKLLDELAFVSTLVEEESTLGSDAVLFSIDGSTLVLTATNGLAVAKSRLTLEQPIPDNEVYEIAASVKKLVDLLPLIKNETVTLNFADTKLTVVAGKGRYTFPILSDVVPTIKSFSAVQLVGPTFTVSAPSFLRGLAITAPFAAKKEKSQYVMKAVGLHATPSMLNFYAMSGDRAFNHIVADQGTEDRKYTLKIASDYASAIAKLKPEGNLTICSGESMWSVEGANRKLYLRVQIGEVPDIPNKMIPKYKPILQHKFTVNSDVLRDSVKRLQIASAAKFKKVTFQVGEGGLKMNANDPFSEVQHFEEEIEVETSDQGSFITDGKYVTDFLSTVEGMITTNFGDTDKDPVLFESESGWHYLVSQVV